MSVNSTIERWSAFWCRYGKSSSQRQWCKWWLDTEENYYWPAPKGNSQCTFIVIISAPTARLVKGLDELNTPGLMIYVRKEIMSNRTDIIERIKRKRLLERWVGDSRNKTGGLLKKGTWLQIIIILSCVDKRSCVRMNMLVKPVKSPIWHRSGTSGSNLVIKSWWTFSLTAIHI